MLVVLCLFVIPSPKAFAVTNGKITYMVTTGNGSVWVMNADGSGKTQLTPEEETNIYPSFAPDGSKIVYTHINDSYDIRTMNPDGSGVNDTGSDGLYYDWLPNNTKISYFNTETFDLYNMDLDGSSLQNSGYAPPLGGNLNFVYDFSPDSTKIAYAIADGDDIKIQISDLDGTNSTVLTTLAFGAAPSFSADGNTIYFIGSTDGSQYSLYSVGTDGSNQTELEPFPAGSPQLIIISPDRTKLLYAIEGDTNATYDVYIMNTDGSNQVQILDEFNGSEAALNGFGWSPDSTKLVYPEQVDGGRMDIFLINADGTGLTNLTNTSDEDEFIGATTQAWGAAPESGSGDQDNIFDSVENAAPNNGDANNDGSQDSEQSNVASFIDPVTGQYAVLQVSNECSITNVSTVTESANTAQDTDFSYPNGLMDFTLDCGTPGFTATVTQYYYGASGNFTVRKYNPNNQTYTTIDQASISQQTIGGQPNKVATYQVTDGGELDLDNTTDGNIHDPTGLAQTTASLADTGQNTTPITILATILLTTGLAVSTYTFNKRRKKYNV
ncbi:DUF5050 domain-containing protein [Candidatus Nomurabacteria bacterium]|nr:DUF5050 domain-containing protein [Candidatus Nomurabacteria bacterium]